MADNILPSRRLRLTTRRIWIVTAEFVNGRPARVTRHADADSADAFALELLAAGAVRVAVEPFRVRDDG